MTQLHWVCQFTGYKLENSIIISSYLSISEHKVKAYVKDLIRDYFVVGMIIDALPQTKLASDIRDLLPEQAFTAYYSDNQKDLYQIKGNEEDITLARTKLYDKVLAIKELWIKPTKQLDKYKEQMQGMVKQRLKDDIIESERFVKVKADHYLHATGYMMAAISVFEGSSQHLAMPTVETTQIK